MYYNNSSPFLWGFIATPDHKGPLQKEPTPRDVRCTQSTRSDQPIQYTTYLDSLDWLSKLVRTKPAQRNAVNVEDGHVPAVRYEENPEVTVNMDVATASDHQYRWITSIPLQPKKGRDVVPSKKGNTDNNSLINADTIPTKKSRQVASDTSRKVVPHNRFNINTLPPKKITRHVSPMDTTEHVIPNFGCIINTLQLKQIPREFYPMDTTEHVIPNIGCNINTVQHKKRPREVSQSTDEKEVNNRRYRINPFPSKKRPREVSPDTDEKVVHISRYSLNTLQPKKKQRLSKKRPREVSPVTDEKVVHISRYRVNTLPPKKKQRISKKRQREVSLDTDRKVVRPSVVAPPRNKRRRLNHASPCNLYNANTVPTMKVRRGIEKLAPGNTYCVNTKKRKLDDSDIQEERPAKVPKKHKSCFGDTTFKNQPRVQHPRHLYIGSMTMSVPKYRGWRQHR